MTGNIFIYGEIGKDVTIESVRKQIDSAASNYDVHISSIGGDVFEGYTIYNLLLKTGKPIRVIVEGLCASIATLIASAGTIHMSRTAQFMIHNPQVSMSGDAYQLRAVAGQLDKIKSQLIEVYLKKTGLSKEKLWDMYDRETWLTAEEAKNLGFIDVIQEPLKAVATADVNKFNYNMDNNETKSILTRIEKMLSNIFKPKNQLTETLEDGTVIVIMSEDNDWVGKSVMYEDGTPVPAGDYILADGKTITVGDGGIISEVTAADETVEEAENEQNEDEQMKAQLDAANARILELESALEMRNKTAVEAENKARTYENSVRDLQKEINKIKNTVYGDPAPPAKKEIQVPSVPTYDPMAAFAANILKGRNNTFK